MSTLLKLFVRLLVLPIRLAAGLLRAITGRGKRRRFRRLRRFVKRNPTLAVGAAVAAGVAAAKVAEEAGGSAV